MDVVVAVPIVVGTIHVIGLFICAMQLSVHPEGLRSDLKAFLEAKTGLSQDWAGAALYGTILFVGCLLWPLSLGAILLYRALHKYVFTEGYTCCGMTCVKRTPSRRQAAESDGHNLEAGLNEAPFLPQRAVVSVTPPVHTEAMELTTIAKEDSESSVASAPPPYHH